MTSSSVSSGNSGANAKRLRRTVASAMPVGFTYRNTDGPVILFGPVTLFGPVILFGPVTLFGPVILFGPVTLFGALILLDANFASEVEATFSAATMAFLAAVRLPINDFF